MSDEKIGGVYVEISHQGDAATIHALDAVKEHASEVGLELAKLSGLGWAVGASMTGAIVEGAKLSVEAFAEAQRTAMRLESAVKASGEAAGLSAQEMQDFAKSLQETTTFGHEATENMEILLQAIGGKQIVGDTFKRAVTTAQDLAVVLGEDLRSAAMQVGKALTDPVNSLTALRRAGVIFTEAQREQIKVWVESGEAAKAQGLILDELSAKVGGAAINDAKALGGKWDQLKNQAHELAEAVGKDLEPALSDVISLMKVFVATPVDDRRGFREGLTDKTADQLRAKRTEILDRLHSQGIEPSQVALLDGKSTAQDLIDDLDRQLARLDQKAAAAADQKAAASLFNPSSQGRAPTRLPLSAGKQAEQLGVAQALSAAKPYDRSSDFFEHFRKAGAERAGLQKEASALINELKTPQERAVEQLQRINQLKEAGLLNPDQVKRAEDEVGKRLGAQEPQQPAFQPQRFGIEDLQARIQEGIMGQAGKEEQATIAKQQLAVAKQMAENIAKIAGGKGGNGGNVWQ
jgi:phage-related minor tail protein